MTALLRTIQLIEQELRDAYGFSHDLRAVDHLLEPTSAEQLGYGSLRGGLLVSQSADDELLIGIHIHPSIVASLEVMDPSTKLTTANLHAFAVVAEEVSHFLHVVDRATRSRPISYLELETQGEIDKLLAAGRVLMAQCGQPHLLPLARVLYDQARIDAEDSLQERYWEATRRAATYWYDLLQKQSEWTLVRATPTLLAG